MKRYLLLFILITGCSIHPPDIKITDEKTALENQILGTYNEIEEDVWMVASVRSSEPGEKADLSEEKEEVLNAYQNREFNKDDIDEFKTDGAVGENNRGLLEIRSSDKLEEDEQYRKLVEQKVAEENRDRAVIMQRIIEVNHNMSEGDLPKVREIFAQMNRDSARAGDWIQRADGKWVTKE